MRLRRTISIDDVTQFLTAKSLVPSTTGRQLERLRDGVRGGGIDIADVLYRLEMRMMYDARLVRCVDGLKQMREVNKVLPELRWLAKHTQLGMGSIVVHVLSSYQRWATQSQERALAEVYLWMCSVEPSLKRVDDITDAFRMNKATSARSKTSRLYNECMVVLKGWIEYYNGSGVSRQMGDDW